MDWIKISFSIGLVTFSSSLFYDRLKPLSNSPGLNTWKLIFGEFACFQSGKSKRTTNVDCGDQRNFHFSLYFLFPCLAAPIFACLLCGSLPREPSLQTICKWYHYWNIIHFLCYFYHQSILNIGAMIGGPLGGWVIDFFGRKLALMITALPFSAGWLMIGFGSNEVLLHAGRFLSGLGVGMASLIVPVSKYVQTWKQSLTNFCLSS